MAEARRRQRDAGVTLIEVLVVLALIGVGAAIVSYSVPPDQRARSTAQEAALLTARLNIATERSLMAGQALRLAWTPQNYAFEEWRDGVWQAVRGAPLNAPHRLEDALTIVDMQGRQRGYLVVSPDLLPPPGGLTTLRLGAGAGAQRVLFDGATARHQAGLS